MDRLSALARVSSVGHAFGWLWVLLDGCILGGLPVVSAHLCMHVVQHAAEDRLGLVQGVRAGDALVEHLIRGVFLLVVSNLGRVVVLLALVTLVVVALHFKYQI